MDAQLTRIAFAALVALSLASCGGGGSNAGGTDAGDPPDTATCNGDADCAGVSCIDGVCCPMACDNVKTDCMACSRALTGRANGVCAPVLPNTLCRASIGICDFAERCDGFSPVCPGDVVLPVDVPCRTATDACDAEERCDGSSPVCPTDVVKPAQTPCRGSEGPCDVTDYCNGTSRSCPNVFRPDTYSCRAATNGVCDAPDYCSGYSAECEDQFASGVVCRYSTGACDITESCSGTSPECPPNVVVPAGIVCRASINQTCNPQESCDGISAQCPADVGTCP